MPTYEFRCPVGHEFERFYGRISESPSEVACPECGAMAQRLISGGAGLLFKGSGFYITDYGKDGKKDLKSAAKPKSESGAKGESGSSTSSGSSESSGGGSTPAAPASKPSKPAGSE
jgi:putative FmdB family regulatory protein